MTPDEETAYRNLLVFVESIRHSFRCVCDDGTEHLRVGPCKRCRIIKVLDACDTATAAAKPMTPEKQDMPSHQDMTDSEYHAHVEAETHAGILESGGNLIGSKLMAHSVADDAVESRRIPRLERKMAALEATVAAKTMAKLTTEEQYRVVEARMTAHEKHCEPHLPAAQEEVARNEGVHHASTAVNHTDNSKLADLEHKDMAEVNHTGFTDESLPTPEKNFERIEALEVIVPMFRDDVTTLFADVETRIEALEAENKACVELMGKFHRQFLAQGKEMAIQSVAIDALTERFGNLETVHAGESSSLKGLRQGVMRMDTRIGLLEKRANKFEKGATNG